MWVRVRVRQGKGGEYCEVPLNVTIRRVLRECLRATTLPRGGTSPEAGIRAYIPCRQDLGRLGGIGLSYDRREICVRFGGHCCRQRGQALPGGIPDPASNGMYNRSTVPEVMPLPRPTARTRGPMRLPLVLPDPAAYSFTAVPLIAATLFAVPSPLAVLEDTGRVWGLGERDPLASDPRKSSCARCRRERKGGKSARIPELSPSALLLGRE